MRRKPGDQGSPYNCCRLAPSILGRLCHQAHPAFACMKTVNKSVLIWYSPEEMFALVTDVAKYPQFLPWCDHATVLETHANGMKAEVGIALGGIRKSFVTRNTHEPGRRVKMELVEGPFSQLDGED